MLMNLKITLTSFLFIFSLRVFSQPTFHKAYGGNAEDRGYSVQQTTDGGYIIAGFTKSFGSGNSDVYLVKTDSAGDTLWTKVYGGIDEDVANYVQQTGDGGYIVAGYTYSFGAGVQDIYVLRTNSTGDTLWTKTYGGIDYDWAYHVEQTNDGGYIIFGTTSDFSGTSVKAYAIKTDPSGTPVWSKTYFNNTGCWGYSARQTSDGGYIFSGYLGSNILLLRTDSLGDTLWTKTWAAVGANYDGSDVIQTADGGYLVGGCSFLGAGSVDVCLVKTDAAGDTLWTKLYGGIYFDNVTSLQQTIDGGYLAAGVTHSFSGGGYSDAYLIKINSAGDTLWTKRYGGFYLDGEYSGARQTSDGGFIIGTTTGMPGSDYDMYLVKTDSTGNTTCRQNMTQTFVSSPPLALVTPSITVSSAALASQSASGAISSGAIITTFCSDFPTEITAANNPDRIISLFPNPASHELRILSAAFKIETIGVYTLIGEEVSVMRTGSKSHEETIDVSNLPAGMYFVKVSAKDFSTSEKFIRE